MDTDETIDIAALLKPKAKKSKQLNLRITPEDYARIYKMAKDNKTNVHRLAKALLLFAVESVEEQEAEGAVGAEAQAN
jgi:predicted HicB family RNase H-like nuclease